MANKGEQLMATAQRSPGVRTRIRGFTLIELMVVVAIVGILVGIALPSYQDSVRKGRRGQAKSDLVELAQRAERYRTVNNSYVGFALRTEDEHSPREGGPFYDVAISNHTANTFTLTATPVLGSGQEKDVRCGALSVDQAGKKTELGTGEVSDCW